MSIHVYLGTSGPCTACGEEVGERIVIEADEDIMLPCHDCAREILEGLAAVLEE